jgi:DnaJ-class molecular chaperone
MGFGTRVAARPDSPAQAKKETCVRCYGTGWVRERGSKIICKPCNGSGRVDTKPKHAS